MASIGSVFLGDFQRLRLLSSSTPPSSPPPTAISGAHPPFPSPPATRASASMESIAEAVDPKQTLLPPLPPPSAIEPALALELRLRWLEAILLGVGRDPAKDRKGKEREKGYELVQGETLIRLAEDVQRNLNSAVEGNDGLKRFMEHCSSSFLTLIH